MPQSYLNAKTVHSIGELKSDDRVTKLGRLQMEYVATIIGLGRHNLEVILTGERRRHYLTDHPEMAQHENELRHVVLNPDEVHRNRKEPHTAIFYRRVDNTYFLRVAIVLQARAGTLKHSVFSFRLAKQKEVEAGRRAGRVIWSKK